MFPEEDLTADDFVRIDGDVGYFRTPDGSRIAVDLRQSPYARRAAAEAIVRRSGGEPRMGVGAQATTMAAPPPAAPPTPPAAAPAEPAAPAIPPPAAGPDVEAQRAQRLQQQRDDEVRRRYALAQMMPAFQQPPAVAPPALVPQPAPVQPAPVAPAVVQAPATPLRVRTEAPSLDRLMVPGGADLGNTLADIVGSTPQQRREDARYGLIDRAADLEARRAQAAADAAAAQADIVDASELRRQQVERERRVAMDDARRGYERAVDQLGAMREDPARLLRSAGGAISAAIAIGLGAAGASLAGTGENSALAIIQRNIDRDIAAQRTDIGTAGNVADARRSVLGVMSQEFSSRDAAESAARAAMLQAAQLQASRVTAGLDNEAARLRGEQLQQQLSDEAAAAAAQAQQQEAEWQMSMRIQGARLQRMELRNAQTMQQMQARAGAGARGRAPTEAQMRQFNTYVESGADPAEAARVMRIAPELVPQSGRFALGTPEGRELTPARMEVINRVLASGGTRAEAAQAAGVPEAMVRRFATSQDDQSASTVSALSAAVDELERMLPAAGEDIPGIGYTGNLPDSMLTAQGRQIRAAVTNVADLVGRLRSGAAISQEEIDRFKQIIGASGRDEELIAGIRRIRREIGSRVQRAPSGQSVTERDVGAAAAAPGFVGRRSE